MFIDQFNANFNPDELNSELVKMVGLIGQTTEKALLEDLNFYINTSTEILNFPESRIRSWLSFFLRPVRNVISAEGYAAIRIPYNTDPNQGKVINSECILPILIGTGDLLQSVSGKTFQVEAGFTITAFNEEYTFRVRQGIQAVSTGTYHTLIAIEAKNADLSRLAVQCAGRAVQAAGVIRSQLVPYDGYYAFTHGDMLYIKIFKGPNTPDPEGSGYSVSFVTSDGGGGNITALSGLAKFKGDIFDSAVPKHKVSYTLTNEDIVNGQDAPKRYELIHELREKFWITTNVASVPEYTAWFRQQPEVGDVLVISDYERWRRSGKKDVTVTGVVTVYLMDKQGEPLPPSMRTTLDDRLYIVRDIAVIEYLDFTYVKQSFFVTYTSASNTSVFVQTVTQTLQNFFNLGWLSERGMSLFEDVDVNTMLYAIPSEFSGYGIEIKPYHSKYFLFVTRDPENDEEYPVGIEFKTPYYDGELFNGFYEWTTLLSDGKTWTTVKLIERPAIDGKSAEIFQASPALVNPTYESVGSRQGMQCLINMTRDPEDFNSYKPFSDGDILKCFWPLANEGVASINLADAARRLMEIRVSLYGSAGVSVYVAQ